MIKVRPIQCSQCGASIEMTKIVNTGATDVFKCEYCGAMLEIVGYKVHGSIADYDTTKYNIPPNADVTPRVETLKQLEKRRGVGATIKIMTILPIVYLIGALANAPDVLSTKPYPAVLPMMLIVIGIPTAFAIALYCGIMWKSCLDIYENNQKRLSKQ